MTEGISIEIIDPAILDGEHFPRMRCVSRKDPDEDICPQLYYCIHRGEQIRPNFPVKYADDCEEYHCICPEKIAAAKVQCKTGYQNCQWIYDGCELVKKRMKDGRCGAHSEYLRNVLLKAYKDH